jgi:hypothetical protein
MKVLMNSNAQCHVNLDDSQGGIQPPQGTSTKKNSHQKKTRTTPHMRSQSYSYVSTGKPGGEEKKRKLACPPADLFQRDSGKTSFFLPRSRSPAESYIAESKRDAKRVAKTFHDFCVRVATTSRSSFSPPDRLRKESAEFYKNLVEWINESKGQKGRQALISWILDEMNRINQGKQRSDADSLLCHLTAYNRMMQERSKFASRTASVLDWQQLEHKWLREAACPSV